MTQAQIWGYMSRRIEDANVARQYALRLYQDLVASDETSAVDFPQFEEELDRLGAEMVKKPRNRRFPTKLPNNFVLLAAAYGTGRDDYLAVVLGFDPERGKLVTWVANFDVGPQLDDAVACGNGHYFDYRDAESMPTKDDCVELFGPEYDRAARQRTLERAWADFFSRATVLMRNAVDWQSDGVPVVP